ncbi:MAG TPA: class I SAM-dependent methyltransferase [Candidatus Eisenbacteria bacterium]|nr:class I SAM-dependent methyltransferase [Candidatus Eisenbacteria bacterium]
MDAAAIEEMSALEDHHWWFVGKRLLVAALLGERLARPGVRVLDVGCGTGGVLASLPGRARAAGVDRSLPALAHCRRRGLGAVAVAEGDRLPFAAASFDVVLMLDVLEHFRDEGALLAGVARVLAPGGALLVSVPAYQALWSAHDEVMHHVRRYTSGRLRAALTAGGFAIDRLTYTNLAPLAPALVVRGLLPRLGIGGGGGSDFRTHAEWVNRALVATYRAEAWAVRRLSLPCGLSVAAVAHVAGAR